MRTNYMRCARVVHHNIITQDGHIPSLGLHVRDRPETNPSSDRQIWIYVK